MIDRDLTEAVLHEEQDEHDRDVNTASVMQLARELRRLRREVGTRKGSSRVQDIYVGLRTGILLARMERAREEEELANVGG